MLVNSIIKQGDLKSLKSIKIDINVLDDLISNFPKERGALDMCFSVFKNTRSIFPRLLYGEARKSARKLFVKTIKALPENYLSYENFRSLLNYFM